MLPWEKTKALHEVQIRKVVPKARFELAHPLRRRILSPLRLPFRHLGNSAPFTGRRRRRQSPALTSCGSSAESIAIRHLAGLQTLHEPAGPLLRCAMGEGFW